MSLNRFFRRSQWDDERARELEAHLAIETDENIARGMAPREARDAARRRLGNATRIREEIYELNTVQPFETLRLDVRDAWRQLRRRPLVAALAVILLTIGIGASSAAFSVVYGVLLRPLPYPDADRLATVWQRTEGRREQLSYPDFDDLRGSAAFDTSAALASGRGTLMAGGSAENVERVNLIEAEPALLPMLGARVVSGRLLGAQDAGRHVALISHRLWRGPFSSDAASVGRTIDVSGQAYTVIGVLAPDLEFELPVGGAALGTAFTIKDVDLWTPFDVAGSLAHNRAVSTYEGVVKLRAGVSVEQAQRALDVAGANLAREYPQTNRTRTFEIVALHEQVVSATTPAVLLAFAGSALMLLITCVNLVSVFLGELPARRREFALREALGAGRGRLLRQVSLESLMLSAAGGVAGVVAANWLVRALKTAADLPRLDAIRFDAPVVLFSIVAAAAAGLAARLAPMARLDSAQNGLRSSIAACAASAPRFRRLLVAVQIALAVVLSATAALFGVSVRQLLLVDPGFDAGHVISARVSAYPSRYPAKDDAVRFFNRLIAGVAAQPEVEAAAAGSALPLSGASIGTSVAVEGRVASIAERPGAGWQTVTPGYFAAVGIPLRAGRDFSLADLARAPHLVIINQSLARLLFGDANPIGRRLALGPEQEVTDWHEIVGVVGDVRHTSLASPATPRAYDLFGQHWSRTMVVVARSRLEPYALAAAVRREVQRLDPQAPMFEVRSLEDILDDSVAARRLAGVFAAGLAGLSVLLSATGFYGLLASTVAARTREFGIRRALGSSSSGIVRLIVGEGAAIAAMGVSIGIVIALAGGRLVQSQLFGVQSSDPRVLAAVATVLVAAAAAAAYLPARRAVRIDPAMTLREE
jgi:putative ABC transport system permease protein